MSDTFSVLDPRLFNFGSNVAVWRFRLTAELLIRRHDRSDLSGHLLRRYQLHEGILPRRVVPASVEWQWMIFHEYNSFLLLPQEHVPYSPPRILCYWLSVLRYGKEAVDDWINSLPWKVPIEKPWQGTLGSEVFAVALGRYQFSPQQRLRLESYLDIE